MLASSRRLVEAGYVAAATLPTRFVGGSQLAWPRVGIYNADGALTFALKVSPVVRSLRRTAAWNLAYRAVRALR